MSKAENADRPRFADFITVAETKVNDGVLGLAIGFASDKEMLDEGVKRLKDEYGIDVIFLGDLHSEEIRDVSLPNGGRGFFFSAEKWKAPWQPKGPKPNWRTDNGDPIQ